jgi:hypothetical protein
VSDVTDMIAAYRGGQLTLDELVQRFRERSWPSRRLSPSTLEYLQGEISVQEYDILARAVGEAGPSQQ